MILAFKKLKVINIPNFSIQWMHSKELNKNLQTLHLILKKIIIKHQRNFHVYILYLGISDKIGYIVWCFSNFMHKMIWWLKCLKVEPSYKKGEYHHQHMFNQETNNCCWQLWHPPIYEHPYNLKILKQIHLFQKHAGEKEKKHLKPQITGTQENHEHSVVPKNNN